MNRQEIVARIQQAYRDYYMANKITNGIVPSEDKIVPGVVRTSTSLVNGNSVTNFIVTQDKTPLNYEVLINRTDAFAILNYGLFLTNEVVATPGLAPLLSYPNETAMTATGVTPSQLEQVYNGTLSIQVAQNVIVPSFPSRLFRSVRTTQQTSATNKSEQLPVDGYATADPLIILDGSQKNILQLTRPAFAGEAVQSSGTTNSIKVVFEAYGYMILGGARN